jgi:hypothetical protein
MWPWNHADARQMAGEAGFIDVSVSVLPVITKPGLVNGAKPALSELDLAVMRAPSSECCRPRTEAKAEPDQRPARRRP